VATAFMTSTTWASLIKKEAFVQNTAAKTTTCVRSKRAKKQAFVSDADRGLKTTRWALTTSKK